MDNNKDDDAAQPGLNSSVPADLAEAMKHGPRGALILSSIAGALLFAGWIAFYYLVFLPRGPIG